MHTLTAVNPATGDVVETFSEMDEAAVSAVLEAAARAQRCTRRWHEGA